MNWPFFDVDDFACLGRGDKEVGLAAQKRRNLKHIGDLGGHLRLLREVNVRDDAHIEPRLDVGQDRQRLLIADA